MSRLRWLSLLMVITILAITGFQLYWLRQNYSREQKALELKTEMLFRQTVLKLQVAKLRLDTGILQGAFRHPGGGQVNIRFKDEGNDVDVQVDQKPAVVSTINMIRGRIKDSLLLRTDVKSGFVIMDREEVRLPDTMRMVRTLPPPGAGRSGIYDFLYNVDSLQDSLRIGEIDSAYHQALQRENIDIPFSVIRSDSVSNEFQQFNEVTVGLARPITYQLKLGNTLPYLLKQITLPILFSFVLLGITVLSFLLLYKNLLRQQRLAAIKNEFISNITHELKTPIATVGVAIEALKSFNAMDDPKRTREYLDISQNELQRLSLLVDKVLKLSMFEKKELELKLEPVDLGKIVEEVVASLRLQLEKNKASLSVTQNGDLQLQGDHLHLLSVVFNLLDNAIKYSQEAPVIDVTVQDKGTAVELRIADQGIGIPQEYQHKVFEKFFRVPQGNTHNAKGYGLGLSYVAEVVEKHQGHIKLESKTGAGTTFIIHIPRQQS